MVRRPRFELSIRESKSRVLPAKLSPNMWWALLDSDQGNRKVPDLQSGAFDHFAKCPLVTAVASHGDNRNVTSGAVCPIYSNGIWKIMKLEYLIFYLQRDIIGSPYWCSRSESNRHECYSQDFKSCTSTNFVTRAFNLYCLTNESNTNLHTTTFLKRCGSLWCTRKDSNFQTLVSKTNGFANLPTRAFVICNL